MCIRDRLTAIAAEMLTRPRPDATRPRPKKNFEAEAEATMYVAGHVRKKHPILANIIMLYH